MFLINFNVFSLRPGRRVELYSVFMFFSLPKTLVKILVKNLVKKLKKWSQPAVVALIFLLGGIDMDVCPGIVSELKP